MQKLGIFLIPDRSFGLLFPSQDLIGGSRNAGIKLYSV